MKHNGNVYLYGEPHGEKKVLNMEFELWNDYYVKGMRHLFVELPYYTAEYLNIWLTKKDDSILDKLYSDWEGTLSHNMYSYEFYKKIKENCPMTIFHGTDVGHQYDSTGKRFKAYLEEQNQVETQRYQRTLEAITQGMYHYHGQNVFYRENKMTENFKRELDNLNGIDIMGIYGAAHVGLERLDNSGVVPCMANQLKTIYGNAIKSIDLSEYAKNLEVIRTDKIRIGNIEYIASYYGKQNLKGFKNFDYRYFWRIENSYNDFKDKIKTGDVLPYNNYPMAIEIGQVFIIDYYYLDKTISRKYYIAEGKIWKGKPTTENFEIN